MTVVKSCVLAAITLTLVAVPAMAQGHRGKGRGSSDTQATAEKKAKDAQTEKDYKAALDHIPDQKPGDPWGNVRPIADKAKSTH